MQKEVRSAKTIKRCFHSWKIERPAFSGSEPAMVERGVRKNFA